MDAMARNILNEQAKLKWPNVPSVFGAIHLDRRKNWYLLQEKIEHVLMLDFFANCYFSDEQGRYFIQNGPQKVYVSLECTPYIVSLSTPQTFECFPRKDLAPLSSVCMSLSGDVYLNFSGIWTLLDDKSLSDFLALIFNVQNQCMQAKDWECWCADEIDLQLHWQGQIFTVKKFEDQALNFVGYPRPNEADENACIMS